MAAAVLDRLCALDRPAVVDAVPPAEDLEPLVVQARGGDRHALEQLLRASYDRVYPVCRRVIGDDFDAADAAQEALISVVRGLGRFDGRSRYSTWLYRIAMNASIDELRRRARRPVAAMPVESVSLDSGAIGPDREDVADRMDVEAALMALPLDYRAAVVLRDVCGMDYAEIAEVLSIPGGTVRSRIARGRSLLAARLGPAREGSA